MVFGSLEFWGSTDSAQINLALTLNSFYEMSNKNKITRGVKKETFN